MPLGHLDVRQASPRFCHFYPAYCKLLSNFSPLPSLLQDVTLQTTEWKPYGSGRLEDVEILQDVRDTHQSHSSEEPQPYPGPVQVDGDKGGRDGEVVNEGIQLQHEVELVRGGNELK